MGAPRMLSTPLALIRTQRSFWINLLLPPGPERGSCRCRRLVGIVARVENGCADLTPESHVITVVGDRNGDRASGEHEKTRTFLALQHCHLSMATRGERRASSGDSVANIIACATALVEFQAQERSFDDCRRGR